MFDLFVAGDAVQRKMGEAIDADRRRAKRKPSKRRLAAPFAFSALPFRLSRRAERRRGANQPCAEAATR
jgi:hypothetical protein